MQRVNDCGTHAVGACEGSIAKGNRFRLISGRVGNFWGFYRNIRSLHMCAAAVEGRPMPIAVAGIRDRINPHRDSNVTSVLERRPFEPLASELWLC
jgi:hypothetical protein